MMGADSDVVETFEGLALGARIAALKWPDGAVKPWLMCLAYGCT
jgi:zinc transporter 1/2/3